MSQSDGGPPHETATTAPPAGPRKKNGPAKAVEPSPGRGGAVIGESGYRWIVAGAWVVSSAGNVAEAGITPLGDRLLEAAVAGDAVPPFGAVVALAVVEPLGFAATAPLGDVNEVGGPLRAKPSAGAAESASPHELHEPQHPAAPRHSAARTTLKQARPWAVSNRNVMQHLVGRKDPPARPTGVAHETGLPCPLARQAGLRQEIVGRPRTARLLGAAKPAAEP